MIILCLHFHYRCRWVTVHCLTPCTRRRWRSSSSFIGLSPRPQWSGRGAKAAVHNTGDTLAPFGSLSKLSFYGLQLKCRTLFHALSVNAAAKDPAFVYGGVSSVANSMIGHPFLFLLSFTLVFQVMSVNTSAAGSVPSILLSKYGSFG